MNHNKLAQKRHSKAQKRKNKKYTGPKYSKLEQMVLWAPILERAGIQMFEEQQPEGFKEYDKESNTSFV